MPENAMYVQTKYNKGTIILAAPFGNSAGGAIIIDSETEEIVNKFSKNDPTVKNDVFRYTIHRGDCKMSKLENESSDFDQSYVDYKHKIQRELGII